MTRLCPRLIKSESLDETQASGGLKVAQVIAMIK